MKPLTKELIWVGYDKAVLLILGDLFEDGLCVCSGIHSSVDNEFDAMRMKRLLEKNGYCNVRVVENIEKSFKENQNHIMDCCF